MCIALCSPNGVRPSESIIDDCFQTNSDGAGIAWPVGSMIRWKKGLDLPGIKAALAAIPENTPYIMHFRIASVGPKVPALTHPFPLTEGAEPDLEGEAASVLFQNGTYGGWEEKLLGAVVAKGFELPPPPWSDARALAVISHVFGPNVLHLLNNSSRFAVFTAGKTVNDRKIKLIGDWHNHEGIEYSNRYCEPFTTRHTTQTTFTPAPRATTGATTTQTTSSGTSATPVRSSLRRPSAPLAVSTQFKVWEPFDNSGLQLARGGES